MECCFNVCLFVIDKLVKVVVLINDLGKGVSGVFGGGIVIYGFKNFFYGYDLFYWMVLCGGIGVGDMVFKLVFDIV